MFFIEAHHQFRISAVRTPGVDNYWAEYLSRSQTGPFYASHHSANPSPSYVNPSIHCTVATPPTVGLDITS